LLLPLPPSLSIHLPIQTHTHVCVHVRVNRILPLSDSHNKKNLTASITGTAQRTGRTGQTGVTESRATVDIHWRSDPCYHPSPVFFPKNLQKKKKRETLDTQKKQ